MAALGPLLDTLGATTKGVTYDVDRRGRLPAPQERRRARRRRPTAARRSRATCTPARRSSRCPAPPTGTSPTQGFQTLEKRTGHAAGRPGGRARGQADHLRRHPGPAGAGDHLAGVVGLGDGRSALLAVHHQRRAAQAVAHPDRPAALLPRPRLDDRARRGAAGVPAAAEHDGAVRRARQVGETGRAGAHGALPDPAQQVVDPLGVPGQPVHAVAVPRRPDDLDERGGRRQDRRRTTTTGSRRSTATASSSPGRSCRTGCPRAPSTCTTRRTG